MMPFILFFPEVARRETRTLEVVEIPGPVDPFRLPVDGYGFTELYCVDANCDCRRVMFNVFRRSLRSHVATINYAFEPPTEEWDPEEQTFLDPLNVQSPLAPRLLDAFKNVLLKDGAYVQRLIRHYQMIKDGLKDAGANPRHPWNQIISSVRSGEPPPPPGGGRTSFLPPKRRGKREWR